MVNKSDLPQRTTPDKAAQAFGRDALAVSALTGKGREELLARLQPPQTAEDEDVVITSERHLSLLRAAQQSLGAALAAFDTQDLDCVAIDIRGAWDKLGEITGVTVTEEVIDRIFDTFCLGK